MTGFELLTALGALLDQAEADGWAQEAPKQAILANGHRAFTALHGALAGDDDEPDPEMSVDAVISRLSANLPPFLARGRSR